MARSLRDSAVAHESEQTMRWLTVGLAQLAHRARPQWTQIATASLSWWEHFMQMPASCFTGGQIATAIHLEQPGVYPNG